MTEKKGGVALAANTGRKRFSLGYRGKTALLGAVFMSVLVAASGYMFTTMTMKSARNDAMEKMSIFVSEATGRVDSKVFSPLRTAGEMLARTTASRMDLDRIGDADYIRNEFSLFNKRILEDAAASIPLAQSVSVFFNPELLERTSFSTST